MFTEFEAYYEMILNGLTHWIKAFEPKGEWHEVYMIVMVLLYKASILIYRFDHKNLSERSII